MPFHHLAAAEDPLPAALLRPTSVLGFVRRCVAGHVLIDSPLYGGQVVRMQALVPRAAGTTLHLAGLVAEHALGGGAVVDVAGVDAPVPETLVCALQCEPKALFALQERLLRGLSRGDVAIDADEARHVAFGV